MLKSFTIRAENGEDIDLQFSGWRDSINLQPENVISTQIETIVVSGTINILMQIIYRP